MPLGSGTAVGTAGVHMIEAPAGRPLILQVAALAGPGPLLVQLNEPVTVLPATAFVGRFTDAAMSADPAIAVLNGTLLLVATGSGVVLPAVTVPVTVPPAGAV